MLTNHLELFKESSENPHMMEHRNEGKIFYHHLCTGNHNSYGVEQVNKIFENKINTDGLMFNVATLIGYLQEGFHRGNIFIGLDGEKSKYKNAEQDYPKLYETLVSGLSEKALSTIENLDMESHFEKSSSQKVKEKFTNNYAKNIVSAIIKDRKVIELSSKEGFQI